MVVVASKEEGANIANYLSYREGALGIKYFGIPVNTCKMYTAELMYVGLKVEKDYQLGKGCLCPQGGGAILVGSSLSSLPNYTLGVYFLLEEVHHKMDSVRANFYWDSRQKKEVPHGEVDRFGKAQGVLGVWASLILD
jgi:hypothetical protein